MLAASACEGSVTAPRSHHRVHPPTPEGRNQAISCGFMNYLLMKTWSRPGPAAF